MQIYRENRIAVRLIVEAIKLLIRKNGHRSDRYLSKAGCLLWEHRHLRMALFDDDDDDDVGAVAGEESHCDLDIRTFDGVKVLCTYSGSHDVHMFEADQWTEALAQMVLEEGVLGGAPSVSQDQPGAPVGLPRHVLRSASE
ncbi:hypothetical protein [Variovorax paradoxus]|uniref:hypothetical protein n=1 Tax=Variovorax paradoxus TaxID=34073 RepID=UPI0019342360|nr:hypothetical protein INQ48_43565 [Variovorax paradoxus]